MKNIWHKLNILLKENFPIFPISPDIMSRVDLAIIPRLLWSMSRVRVCRMAPKISNLIKCLIPNATADLQPKVRLI